MKIEKKISLKSLNAFGLDASAKFFVKIKNFDDIKNLLETDVYQLNDRFILGAGSNILFSEDYQGLIIKPEMRGIRFVQSDDEYMFIEASAGENWDNFVQICYKNKFYGLENLAYIPGTVGAAPFQNIGAYGVEQKDFFHSLSALELSSGIIHEFSKSECDFKYRSSIFKTELKDKFLITSVIYKLSKNPVLNLSYKTLKQEIEKFPTVKPDTQYLYDTVKRIRQSKLPDPKIIGNAGSFFKNPIVDDSFAENIKANYNDIPIYNYKHGSKKISAAWLIEKAGWKGKRFGNCGVYEKHSLILVNYGGATGKNIIKLSELIEDSVFDMFGIKLEKEVQVV